MSFADTPPTDPVDSTVPTTTVADVPTVTTTPADPEATTPADTSSVPTSGPQDPATTVPGTDASSTTLRSANAFLDPTPGLLAAARQALQTAQVNLASAIDAQTTAAATSATTEAAATVAAGTVSDDQAAVQAARDGVVTARRVQADAEKALAAAQARLTTTGQRVTVITGRLRAQAVAGYVGGPERGAAAWLGTDPEHLSPASATYLAAAAGWTGDDLARARQTETGAAGDVATAEAAVTDARQAVTAGLAAVDASVSHLGDALAALATARQAADQAAAALVSANQNVDWVKLLAVEAEGRVSILGGDPSAVAPPTAAPTTIVRPWGHVDPVTGVANTWVELDVAPATPVLAVETGVVTGLAWSDALGWTLTVQGASGTAYVYGRLGAYVGGIDVGIDVMAGETIAYVGTGPAALATDPATTSTTAVTFSEPAASTTPTPEDGTRTGTLTFEMRPFDGQPSDPATFLTPLMARTAALRPQPVMLPAAVTGGPGVEPVRFGQLEQGGGISVRSIQAEWGATFPLEVTPVLQWGFSQIGTPYAAINPYRFGRSVYGAPWDCPPGQAVCTRTDMHNGDRTIAAGGYAYDCSGLMVAAWLAGGVDLVKRDAFSSQLQKDHLPPVTRAAALPGDLVIFDGESGDNTPGTDHVGMYLDDGHMLHAGSCKSYLGVCVTTIDWDHVVAVARVR